MENLCNLCLVSEDESYVDKIDENNMGSDEGLSFDNNDWAISDDFSWGWVNSMLIKEAKRIGVEII